MKSEVTTKRVTALKTAALKVDPNSGELTHVIAVECVLEPGDLERVGLMFKQQLPVVMTISSPQARMDLQVVVFREDRPIDDSKPVDTETLREIKEGAEAAGLEINDPGSGEIDLSDPERREANERILAGEAEDGKERADAIAPVADPDKPARARRSARTTAG